MNAAKDISLEHAPDGSHMDNLIVEAGISLSADEVEQLELSLDTNNDDLSARLSLLGFYSNLITRVSPSDNTAVRLAAGALHRQVLWMIDNRPTDNVSGTPPMILQPLPNLALEVKEHWLAQVERQPLNAKLLRNAALFFTQHEGELADALFKQAEQIDPDGEDWS